MRCRVATLRIQGLDNQLYTALSAQAMREHRSINQVVLTLLHDSLTAPSFNNRRATEEFLSLAGSWADNRPEKSSRANSAKNADPEGVLEPLKSFFETDTLV